MKGFWSDTRPNGKPVEPGSVCWITDLEDGTHPIYTYGKDAEEVLQKLALQNANAQETLARRAAALSASAAAPPPPAARRISPDDIQRATADLDNPAKSGAAITTLLESATGLDVQQIVLQNFGMVGDQWEKEHPEFFSHAGNRRLLTQEAVSLAGGNLGHVTGDHLTKAYNYLRAQGFLLEDPGPHDDQSSTAPQSFPDESPVQRSERPKTRFATGSRSTNFQRQQAPTRTLKYTEEEIRKMPLSKSKALIAANDKDYAEACDHYFGSLTQAPA
jgi:hypothetical protein